MDALNQEQRSEIESLESPTTVVEPNAPAAPGAGPQPAAGGIIQPAPAPGAIPPTGMRLLLWIRSRLNIYLILFIVLLLLAGTGGGIFYIRSQNQQPAPDNGTSAQSLSQSALDQLSSSDVTVGEPQHTLSVQSNAVFTGNVLVRSNLQIAGALQVGSNLALNGLRVTGNSTFDDVQVSKSLAVTGNGSIQGQLNVSKGLDVSGGGTFSGVLSAPSLTVSTLQLNGSLNLTHHITAGGGTPSRSNGPALGGGGTVSVSGSDTAGSVTINTGTGPAAGCFVNITFATAFNSTPHIVITPVGSGAAGLKYYVTRTTTGFSICTASAAPGSSKFGFDYLAFD